MVAATGVPGAKDNRDAGSFLQPGQALTGHTALGARLRVRPQAEFLGEELNSKAEKEGSGQTPGDKQEGRALPFTWLPSLLPEAERVSAETAQWASFIWSPSKSVACS